jgi:hypothetical protein
VSLFASGIVGIVDTGGKFATGINNTRGTSAKFTNGGVPSLSNISAFFEKI